MRSRGQNDLFQKILLPVRFHGLDNSEDSLSHGHSLHLSYRPYRRHRAYWCHRAYGRYRAYWCHRAYGRYRPYRRHRPYRSYGAYRAGNIRET